MNILKANRAGSKFFYGVASPAQAAFVAREAVCGDFAMSNADLSVVVLPSQSDAELFYMRLKAYLDIDKADVRVRVLPQIEEAQGQDADRFDASCERIGTLNAVRLASSQSTQKTIVLATPDSILSKAPKPEASDFVNIEVGGKVSLDDLKKTLILFGYYNEVLCESPGQFAVRGGIIDVYPIAAHSPVRIELFGDCVDNIRNFDHDTQLSDGTMQSVRIDSATQAESDGRVLDYFKGKRINWFMIEPSELASKFGDAFFEFENIKSPKSNLKSVLESADATNGKILGVSAINAHSGMFDGCESAEMFSQDLSEFRPPSCVDLIGYEAYEAESSLRGKFIDKIISWARGGYEVFMEAASESEQKRIKELFAERAGDYFPCNFVSSINGEGFIFEYRKKDSSGEYGGKESYYPLLLAGREKPGKQTGVVFVSSYEFFGRRVKVNLAPRRKVLSRRAQVDQLLDFSELGEGDYVVHLGQGVCRYHGVVELQMGGVKQEVIKLEFEDQAYLYLPLHKSYLISRYIGLEKAQPKLSRLDSKSWIKVRTAAEMAALDYASELLDMQSKREVSEGFSFPQDDKWQKSFEDSFPFVETKDQLRAINEVKADMEDSKPMERLICADVGFGKTEVAMRAAFKCALAGKQAAILCPTTILCQQHFKNFKERMAGYPIVVEMLSRFRTPREAAKIREQLASGKIDVVIGTHALLSDKVSFKDLGLLVIDEEHRFGVKHKEKIKRLKESIDVLTMSATPIPRTLYFAMMGAKKISLIETPPKNRFPVETIVKEYSDQTVVEAINAEVARGGQVFYLHNRVKSIEETADRIKKLFPNLRVGVGHGQMDERELENLMGRFIDGKFDILVCTTIIESGLDIPNCNTIIIEGADKFGLAQLYQLRGRVGRFTRRAYAYLLLHRHAKIVEGARKRLGAIRQYNTVGAGFRIATRDLQLRGCGNLLGAKQSGHIAGVGFDMYCRLLKQSIARLKGDKNASAVRAEVYLDFIQTGLGVKPSQGVGKAENYFQEIRIREAEASRGGEMNAFISPKYISQVQLRIDLYRRISLAVSEQELEELLASTIDRFGTPPPETAALFEMSRIRVLAESAGVLSVETEGDRLKLRTGGTSAAPEYFKVFGHFPRLTKSKPEDKLVEIKYILKNIYSSAAAKASNNKQK